MKIAFLLACAALLHAVAPVAAMPRVDPPHGGAIKLARTVCDEWGMCWERPDYRYSARPRYGYDDYDDDPRPYGGYYPRRPQTKWERKGFCPPGQHKKGNC